MCDLSFCIGIMYLSGIFSVLLVLVCVQLQQFLFTVLYARVEPLCVISHFVLV